MKRTLLAALALFFTISSGLAAAGNMTFSTLHPTNSASGTFESTSWLAYKQTEALARMADALAGSGLVVTGTVVTLTNVSAMIAGQTGPIDMNQTNAIPAGSNDIGTVHPTVSTNYVGGFTSICKGAISNDTSASYAIGDVYAAIFTCTNASRTAGGGVTWQSFKLFTGDDAQFDFEVFMFTQVPASLGNSNTVWSVSTADLANYCCGKMTSLDFPNGWSDLGTNRMFAADFVKSMKAATGTNDLFMAIRTLTTATQGTNQPSVRLDFWQD